jgi:DNA repair protein RadC
MNALTNVAEITIQYSSKVKPSDRPKITGSREAAEILRSFFGETLEHHESFYAMYLNRANKVLGVTKIGQGGTAGCVADPKIIFQGAIKANACGIILCHNHPSGNMTASQQDIDLTKKLVAGGKIIDVQVLDHVILSPEEDKHFSFADEGLI